MKMQGYFFFFFLTDLLTLTSVFDSCVSLELALFCFPFSVNLVLVNATLSASGQTVSKCASMEVDT